MKYELLLKNCDIFGSFSYLFSDFAIYFVILPILVVVAELNLFIFYQRYIQICQNLNKKKNDRSIFDDHDHIWNRTRITW